MALPRNGRAVLGVVEPGRTEDVVRHGVDRGRPTCGSAPTGPRGAFGSYSAFHFLDADNGQRTLPDVETGDINKGSATLDADGFPLYYAGSRDNQLRIIALDRPVPEVLWSLGHDDLSAPVWNSDWDGAPLVLGDYLFEGGENSYFHVVKLNRSYGPDGLVTVDPEVVFHAPGFDDELLSAIGDKEVSIESSVTITGNVVYFANSGGLVSGYDISGLAAGRDPERVFRYWMGDDVDATIATDAEGYLYVGAEVQRYTGRTREVVVAPSPSSTRAAPTTRWCGCGGEASTKGAGIWSTAAIVGPAVILSTDDGPGRRSRPGHGSPAVAAHHRDPGVDIARGGGRRDDRRRLRGRAARLLAARPADRTHAVVDQEVHRLPGSDSHRLEGSHLPRFAATGLLALG